jgi:tetratricopeptide (TPR) repeat protein
VKKILKRAKIFADKALRKYSKNPDILFLKAMICVGLEDNTNAVKYFEKTQKILPDEKIIVWEKANCLMWGEKYEKALSAFDLAMENNPDNTNILSDKAFCLYSMGEHEQALEVYKKILKIDPTNTTAEYRSILPLLSLKRYDEIIRICNNFHNDEEDLSISSIRAEALFGLKKFEEAIQAVDKIGKWNPTMHVGMEGFILDALLIKGKCFERLNEFEDAKKIFQEVIKKCKDKDDIDKKNEALEVLGHINWMQDEHKKAKKYFSQLIDTDKSNSVQLLDRTNGAKFAMTPFIYSKTKLEKLLKSEESKTLEFKSSLRYPYEDRPENQPDLSRRQNENNVVNTTMKTICAFLNSEGGNLVIGVKDDKTILGIEPDFKYVGKNKSWDAWNQLISNYIRDKIGAEFNHLIHIRKEIKNNKMIAVVSVDRSEHPVYLFPNGKNGAAEFYTRSSSSSDNLDVKKTLDHLHKSKRIIFRDDLTTRENKPKP